MKPADRARLAVVAVALVAPLAWLGPAAAQLPAPGVPGLLDELELAAGGPVRAEIAPETGLVEFLSFGPGRSVPMPPAKSAPAAERALAFVDRYGRAFGIAHRAQLALVRASVPDEVGMEHVRFRQTWGGVPVTGGELTVHLSGSNVVAVNGKTLAGLDHLATVPTVTPLAAVIAVDRVLERRLGVTGATFTEPRLELFNRGLLEGRKGWTRLAWFVEARAVDLREYFWVDAESGAVLLHFSQLTDALDRQIYDADDPGDGLYDDLPGVLVRSEGEAPTGAGDADDAYDYSGDTYDYFFDEHGRDSYDGMGATLVSTVHFCPSAGECPFVNAFWNGVQMVYGDGFPAADDVDAHELTHAVTEFSANLFYYMQSGALNESYSDIFGETVDLTNAGGTDTPAVRWQMGEDVPGIGAIRDMEDPTLFGDPGKMSDPEFVCQDPGGDAGGVHSNSGVPNHAYALMVDGGSYNGETVTGIGLTKAGKIQYRALTAYLGSASDFLDNYNALNQACQDLVGTAGITAADCVEVDDALRAVEMDDPWPCAPAQAAAPDLCSAGQAPELLYADDLESSPLTPCPSAILPSAWCLNQPTSFLGTFATSGSQSFWGYNRPTAGSMLVTVDPSLASLPAGARLQFNHSYGFENTGTSLWDGGVVEYSTDGGGSWSDGGSLITAGQGYAAGTVSTCCSNPLGGRSAFARDSWGYTASQLDLSTLTGLPFRFRFLVGTDFSIDEYGWFVDDPRIYTCAACVTDRILDSTYNGLADEYKATGSVTAGGGFTVGPMESVKLQAGTVVTLENDTAIWGDLEIALGPCS